MKAVLTFRRENKLGSYADALRTVGIEPVPVTPGREVDSWSGLGGLVLSGGTDLDPALYGETRHERADEPDRERDELELRLLNEALELDLPVLAICRGMQLFNVAHTGGTLVQHMEGHKGVEHPAAIETGTHLAEILGAGERTVNSRHHQAVAKPGAGLRVSARAADGVIEALERPDRRFAIAVQWHPEDMLERFPEQRRLFEALGAAMRG